jgi:hypothetical protein
MGLLAPAAAPSGPRPVISRFNLYPHLHFLVTEGGVDAASVFHEIPRIDDSRLAEIFARVTSYIPDKGQVIVRHYGLYANARIHGASEADVRGGEAPAVPCFYRGRLMEAEESGEYF